ncbi:MAG: acyloxyacyl hydrolase [Bacteroidetes bacterium]|nr:acyloxyacyl hydrolase [Bacteroidota bacterium]
MPDTLNPAYRAWTGLACLLLCLWSLSGRGQFDHRLINPNLVVEAKLHYGFIFNHHIELAEFDGHFPAFEISLARATYGKQKWEQLYNYPIIGIGFWYSALSKSPGLGSAAALFPYINYPLFRVNNFALHFRFALGLGYLTKKFDRIENYKNLAIGSHFNAAVNLMLEARYKVGSRLTLAGGISLQHFSNGSLKLPNYGLNIPMINVSAAYLLKRPNKNITDRLIPPTDPFEAIPKRNIEIDLIGGWGTKNMEAIFGQNYMVFSLASNTFLPVTGKSKWGIGWDLTYDQSDRHLLHRQNIDEPNDLKIVKSGISAAYQLNMSHLAYIFNFGYYLSGREKSDGPIYQKIGFQLAATDNFLINVTLKVHYGRADFVTWGLGYRFKVKY